MRAFLASQWGNIFSVLVCVFMFMRGYMRADDHRPVMWAQLRLTAQLAGATLLLTALAWATHRHHEPFWTTLALGAAALVSGGWMVREITRLLACNDAGKVDETPRYELSPLNTETARFGEHELIVRADDIWSCRHMTLRNSWMEWLGIALGVTGLMYLWLTGYHVKPFAVGLLYGLFSVQGNSVGSLVKMRRLRQVLQVQGDRLLVESKDVGRVAGARIEVMQEGKEHSVRLAFPSGSDPLPLVSTRDKTGNEAKGIADAIREFLKQRQSGEVWPPAPEAVGVDE